MTAHSQKTKQKRLHSCVLAHPKGLKLIKNPNNRACGTIKISDPVANAAVRVANVQENGQPRRKAILLGKYPLKYLIYRIIRSIS